LHTPAEIGIDSFEADRAPDGVYKTMNLAGIFVRENGLFMRPANKGRYYHDGRFATLLDVVNHYNTRFSLGLTPQEKLDVVEYLKSLPAPGIGNSMPYLMLLVRIGSGAKSRSIEQQCIERNGNS